MRVEVHSEVVFRWSVGFTGHFNWSG